MSNRTPEEERALLNDIEEMKSQVQSMQPCGPDDEELWPETIDFLERLVLAIPEDERRLRDDDESD